MVSSNSCLHYNAVDSQNLMVYSSVSNSRRGLKRMGVGNPDKVLKLAGGGGIILNWSRWKHRRYVRIGRVQDRLGESLEGWRKYFSYLKNIQFACSIINPSYLGHGALNNRPTSRAARREKWGIRVLISSVK